MPDFIKKCGVICTTILPMKPEYQLICIICNTQFTQLDNFILHFDTEHRSSLDETILNDSQENSEDEFSTENLGCMQHNIEIRNLKSRSLISGKYQAKNSSTICMESEDVDTDIKEDILESECVEKDCSNDDWENEFMNENKSVESLNEFLSETEIDATLHEEIYEIMEGGVNVADIVHNNIESDNPDVVNPDESAKPKDLLATYGKPMLLKILSVCAEHPVLWDDTALHANNSWFRERSYKSIAVAAGKRDEWKVIRQIIQRLRVRIRKQFQKKQDSEKNGKSYKPLWEDDIVAFLQPAPKAKKKKLTESMVKGPTSLKKEKRIVDCKDVDEREDSDWTETESDAEHTISPTTAFNKETLSAIFESYTNHDILWNVNDPMNKDTNMRRKALMSIASDIGKPSEWRTIRDVYQRLRTRLQKEAQMKKLAEINNEPFVPSWKRDMNSFLKPTKTKTYIAISKRFKLPDSKLSDSECLQLIEIYKSFPCLWDEQDITYRFKNRRQEAMIDIQKKLADITGIELTQVELESEIKRIRKMCSQEKEHKLNSNSIYEPECKFYDKIAFLEVDVGPFKCSVCAEVLDSINQYKIHKSTHDGSMPFSCVVCKQGFTQIGNMTVHLRRHAKDYEFECDVCKKQFATSTDLNVHRRGHTGEKPYFCDICGESFKTWGFFDTHSKRHQNIKRFKCEICSKTFLIKTLLLDHMGTHLSVRDQICNVCGKAFSAKKHLRQHKQIHEAKKKYSCRICEKQFAQYAGLSGHMKTHGTTLVPKL